MPLWVNIILVPLLSFAFLIVAITIRVLAGLPNGTPAWDGIAFLAWIGYTICWMVFAIMGHNKQGYNTYFP